MRIITKVKDFFKYDIPYGVKNLIRWFPVIWKDRNWDHYFIYVILRHKLRLMEHNIRHYGCHVHNERDADQIKKCILLLDRLIKDNYHEIAFKNHEKKWGEPQLTFEDIKDKPDLQGVYINHPNVKTEQDEKQEKKEFRRSCEHETNLRKQDLDMLFKLMRKHIEGWWD